MINKIRIPLLIFLSLITLVAGKCDFNEDEETKAVYDINGQWEINNLKDAIKQQIEINKNQKGPKAEEYIKVMTLAEFSVKDKRMKLTFQVLGPDGSEELINPNAVPPSQVKKVLVTIDYQYEQNGHYNDFEYMDEIVGYDKVRSENEENRTISCDGGKCPPMFINQNLELEIYKYSSIRFYIREYEEEGAKKIKVLLNDLKMDEYPSPYILDKSVKGEQPISHYILKQVSN